MASGVFWLWLHLLRGLQRPLHPIQSLGAQPSGGPGGPLNGVRNEKKTGGKREKKKKKKKGKKKEKKEKEKEIKEEKGKKEEKRKKRRNREKKDEKEEIGKKKKKKKKKRYRPKHLRLRELCAKTGPQLTIQNILLPSGFCFIFESHSLGEIAEQGRIGASFSLDSKLGRGGEWGPGFFIVQGPRIPLLVPADLLFVVVATRLCWLTFLSGSCYRCLKGSSLNSAAFVSFPTGGSSSIFPMVGKEE